MSATGIVTHQGAISSTEHVTIASAQDLAINHRIRTKLGTISLVSTEGSVTVNTLLNSGIDVGIIARINIRTLGIRTNEGNIVLEAELGQANINGNIVSHGGDFYVSGRNRVNTRNIISSGGNVSLISDLSSINTGYIRTDGQTKEGDVYLEALNNVKVTGLIEIDNIDYSIYAGNQGTVSIVHQQLRPRTTASDSFLIASSSPSGSTGVIERPTITDTSTKPINKPPVYSPKIPQNSPRGGNLRDIRAIIIFETFRRILDAGNAEAPTLFVGKVNPLTGLPYVNDAEKELIESLTRKQQSSIRKIITNDNIEEEERLKAEDFRVGTLDEHGCFYLVLGRQLGNYEEHDLYSLEVTGDITDHLWISPRGNYQFYDGKLTPLGEAFIDYNQTLGSYAEVKTQYEYFEKAVSDMTPSELGEYLKMKRQIEIGNYVAFACKFPYFLSFDNAKAANGIRSKFGQYNRMNIHHIERIF